MSFTFPHNLKLILLLSGLSCLPKEQSKQLKEMDDMEKELVPLAEN